MTNQNSAQQRVALTEDLHNELYDLIHEHGRMVTLTVVEVIGVLEVLKMELLLEVLKMELLLEQQQPDEEEDE